MYIMFIFSLSPKKVFKKLIFFSGLAMTIIVTMVFVFLKHNNQKDIVNYEGGSYNTQAETVEEISNFLKQFGWEINPQPVEVSNIIIPSEFNDIYEHYNDIQKQQGLDLSGYKGKECKKYCFKILNYPNNDDVIATLIICNGNIIAGDISETVMDGFMQKFTNV